MQDEHTVIESVGQSVISSMRLWIGSVMVRGEEESRFDLFVIGLQGVINRPELKQHLRCRTVCDEHKAEMEDV